jgi:hypothetical protein
MADLMKTLGFTNKELQDKMKEVRDETPELPIEEETIQEYSFSTH